MSLMARYAGAVVAVLAAYILRYALENLAGGGLPYFITFYPAVMLVALLSGLGPGLLAVFFSILLSDYFILSPQGYGISDLADIISLIFFSAMGVLMTVVVERYRRTRSGLEAMVTERTEDLSLANEELSRQIRLSRRSEDELRKAHDELEEKVRDRTSELTRINKELEGERRRFHELLDNLPVYVILLSGDYRVPFANRFFEERFGKSGGARCYEYLFDLDEPCETCETFKVLKTGGPHRWEWTGPDGRNYDIFDFPFTDTDGSPLILEVGLDVTEHKRIEAEIRSLNAELDERVRQRTVDLQAANEGLRDSRLAALNLMEDAVEARKEAEETSLDLQEEIIHRQQAEDRIRITLQEKETLLRELYHRTKNNMNVISGLISLQSASLKDSGTLQMFRDLQDRIKSMALVHQKLYQSGNLSEVNLGEYISDLAHSLLESYTVGKGRIALRLDADSFTLSIDTIIPCGLVINELISNSLKYAFPGGREGEIGIEARMAEDGEIRIRYNDNGVGLPGSVDLKNTRTLGLKLVKRLVEGQLGGKVELRRNGATEFIITFHEPHYTKRL